MVVDIAAVVVVVVVIAVVLFVFAVAFLVLFLLDHFFEPKIKARFNETSDIKCTDILFSVDLF